MSAVYHSESESESVHSSDEHTVTWITRMNNTTIKTRTSELKHTD